MVWSTSLMNRRTQLYVFGAILALKTGGEDRLQRFPTLHACLVRIALCGGDHQRVSLSFLTAADGNTV